MVLLHGRRNDRDALSRKMLRCKHTKCYLALEVVPCLALHCYSADTGATRGPPEAPQNVLGNAATMREAWCKIRFRMRPDHASEVAT